MPARNATRARFGGGAALAFLVGAAVPGPVASHGGGSGSAVPDGVAIPALAHGQMIVLADHRAEIVDLASRRIDVGESFRRVASFANIQFAACLWGLVPDGVRDESSPFNECSHAYLAATAAMLSRMRAAADRSPAVDALAARIERDMQRESTSLELCRHSAREFSTGHVVAPRWRDIPRHSMSLAAFGGAALVVAGAVFGLARVLATPGAGAASRGRTDRRG